MRSALQKTLGSGLSSMRFQAFGLLTTRQIRKNKTNYCLGFFSCWVVVFLVAVLDTGLQRAPVAFLKLAELQTGEQDVVLQPGDGTGAFFLNYTTISSRLTQARHGYRSPRYTTEDAFAFARKTCDFTGADPAVSTWIFGTPADSCIRATFSYDACCMCTRCPDKQKINLYVIDFAEEQRIGVGRAWGSKRPAKGSVYIDSTTARLLGVSAGDRILIKTRADELMVSLVRAAKGRYASSYGSVYLDVKVHGTVGGTQGKTAEEVRGAVFLDFADLPDLLTNLPTMHPALAYLAPRWRAVDFREYSSEVTVQLPPPRIDVYVDPSYDVILERVVDFASSVLFAVGFDQVTATMPVATQLGESKTFSLYLSLLLAVIFALLLLLALILIYSLLMISVQTRTFELGLLRMVGVTRRGVLELLLVHAMAFSVPAWILGLVVAQIVAVPAMRFISRLVESEISPLLFPRSVGAATAVAFAVPLVAAVLPIRSALRSNLHDALDTRHSKTKAVVYTIERAEDNDLPWGVLLIGFMLAVFGFLIYYVVPLALLSFDLLLLLGIFFALLMGMIAGCVILLMNVEHFVQRLVVLLFFFWEGPSVRSLIRKNLVAHRPRNRKTTVMYALALGFIIFISVAANLQIETFRYQSLQRSGTYIRVWAPSYTQLNDVLPALEDVLQKTPHLAAHAYVTKDLRRVWSSDYPAATKVLNLGRAFSDGAQVYGVSPYFHDAAESAFLILSDQRLGGALAPAMGLATLEGSQQAVLGSTLRSSLGLSLASSFLLSNDRFPDDKYRRLQPWAFADQFPGFKFSKFPTVTSQDVLLSLPSYLRLLRGAARSVDELPISRLFVKLRPSATAAQRNELVSALAKAARGNSAVEVWNYYDRTSAITTASRILDAFFAGATVIAMFLCLFSLTASMYSNIHEQAKEIGVLRAMGATRLMVVRLYCYEAFSLVISASLLALLIGLGIGYTMTLQRFLFTQLPVPFYFPYVLVAVIFGMAVACALASSAWPAWTVVRASVVDVMRRLD